MQPCLTLRGWPDCRQQVPWITRHFWGAQDKLFIESSLLFKGAWVCIPPELLNCTLADLHRTHQGIDRMQAQAKEAVYWPSIDADITMSASAPVAQNTKPLPMHSLCYLGISPMAHDRRFQLITSLTRVKNTCLSVIYLASNPYCIWGIH